MSDASVVIPVGVAATVVIVGGLYVAFDSHALGARRGLITGGANMGSFGWWIATTLIFPVVFPYYLAKRPLIKVAGEAAGLGDIAEWRASQPHHATVPPSAQFLADETPMSAHISDPYQALIDADAAASAAVEAEPALTSTAEQPSTTQAAAAAAVAEPGVVHSQPQTAAATAAVESTPQSSVVLPPAGWYPDPYNTSRLRYWDGQAWAAA